MSLSYSEQKLKVFEAACCLGTHPPSLSFSMDVLLSLDPVTLASSLCPAGVGPSCTGFLWLLMMLFLQLLHSQSSHSFRSLLRYWRASLTSLLESSLPLSRSRDRGPWHTSVWPYAVFLLPLATMVLHYRHVPQFPASLCFYLHYFSSPPWPTMHFTFNYNPTV